MPHQRLVDVNEVQILGLDDVKLSFVSRMVSGPVHRGVAVFYVQYNGDWYFAADSDSLIDGHVHLLYFMLEGQVHQVQM